MVKFTSTLGHLIVFNLLILGVVSYAVDTIPLCNAVDASWSSKKDHRIHYKDIDNGITTIEVNGTIIGCYPDPLSDDVSPSTNRSFTPKLSKCADRHQDFCIKDDTYPIEYVEHLLQKHWRLLSYLFGSDSQVTYGDLIDPHITIEEEDMCSTRDEIVFPTVGQKADGTELYIVNTADHKQGISVSTCEKEHQPCRFAEHFPAEYTTDCRQHHIYRELLAISHEGVPVKEKFLFPAFCTCTVLHY